MTRHKSAPRRAPRSNRRAHSIGFVPMAQLRREINEGHRRFFAKRGMEPAGLEPTFARAPVLKPTTGNSLDAVARAYAAMDHPRRGTLLRMAQVNNLNYNSLATRVYEVRGGRTRRLAA